MKLGKFLKHIDFCMELEIYDEQENIIYAGDIIPFHAAGDKDKGERFCRECLEDEDYKAVNDTNTALKLYKRKLLTDNNGEAVSVKRYVNEHGVERFILIIYVKGVGK